MIHPVMISTYSSSLWNHENDCVSAQCWLFDHVGMLPLAHGGKLDLYFWNPEKETGDIRNDFWLRG